MPSDRRPVRWGVRTLLYLTLALLAIVISNLQNHYTLLTLAGLLIGLIGAMICTVRGIAALYR